MVTSARVGFRSLQAAHDLVAFVQSAPDEVLDRLAAAVPPVDLSRHIAAEALHELVHVRQCRFETETDLKLHETLLLAATLPGEDRAAFDVATALLLADRLRGGRGPDDLYWHWDALSVHYQRSEPVARAAILNGFIECQAMGRLPAGTVDVAPLSAVDPDRVRIDLRELARGEGEEVLISIARLDDGRDAGAHFAALREVIRGQDLVMRVSQGWVPGGVVERASLDPGHPGFLAATAILLSTALARGDDQGWFDERWEKLASAYDALPAPQREAVMAGVRYLYESDAGFAPYASSDFAYDDHPARMIPPLAPARPAVA